MSNILPIGAPVTCANDRHAGETHGKTAFCRDARPAGYSVDLETWLARDGEGWHTIDAGYYLVTITRGKHRGAYDFPFYAGNEDGTTHASRIEACHAMSTFLIGAIR